jgi:hypothetical protein
MAMAGCAPTQQVPPSSREADTLSSAAGTYDDLRGMAFMGVSSTGDAESFEVNSHGFALEGNRDGMTVRLRRDSTAPVEVTYGDGVVSVRRPQDFTQDGHPTSNEVEVREGDTETRLEPDGFIERCGLLREGMGETEVLGILGAPNALDGHVSVRHAFIWESGPGVSKSQMNYILADGSRVEVMFEGILGGGQLTWCGRDGETIVGENPWLVLFKRRLDLG